jgi:uncharacterized membrane protein
VEEGLPEDAQSDDVTGQEAQGLEPQEAKHSRPLSINPDALPPSQREAIIHAQLEFSGPLPPPQILGQYDEVLPGAAERILRMAEKQQDHRIGVDQSGIRRANWGLGAGYSLSVMGLISTTFLVMHGHDVAGSVLGGSTFLSLVSTFVYGSIVRSRENIEKTRLLTGHEEDEDALLQRTEDVPKRAKKRKR